MLRSSTISFLLGAHLLGQTPLEPEATPIEPNPLILRDGEPVVTAKEWRRRRRPEVLELFRRTMYGRSPASPGVSIEAVERGEALDGKALRRQWRVRYAKAPEAYFEVLMYAPLESDQPAPAFLGLNFFGNASIHQDPDIRLSTRWMPNNKRYGIVDHRASATLRGVRASRWPVERIIQRGYALVTVYYGDIDPDFDDGFANGVHGILDPAREGERPPDAWGSIAAWAWGLSRVLDSLESEPRVDAQRVAVIGHSRLGKTALWAGAQDERFAMVISNNSGCGGAAYSRRRSGETVARINRVFPHWFCRAFHAYGDREQELPIDQHLLIALIAPRPAYVASAAKDLWADPAGEFLSVRGASPVYRLLGTSGLPATTQPPVGQPVHGRLGYHIRAGKHDLRWEDWRHYLAFADRHLGKADK